MRLTMLISLLGVFTGAHAEIYRWTDANGQVRFSDRPPVNQPYSIKRVEPRAPAATTSVTEPASENSAKATEANEPHDDRRPASDTAAIDPAELARRCTEAKKRIAFYERTPAVRLLYENDAGQTVRMTPGERSRRIKQNQDIASQSCR